MTERKYVAITALVDDHAATEEVLRSLIERELPGARVFRPRSLPEHGFELVIASPTPMLLHELEARVAAELDRHEILHAELHLDVLDDG